MEIEDDFEDVDFNEIDRIENEIMSQLPNFSVMPSQLASQIAEKPESSTFTEAEEKGLLELQYIYYID